MSTPSERAALAAVKNQGRAQQRAALTLTQLALALALPPSLDKAASVTLEATVLESRLGELRASTLDVRLALHELAAGTLRATLRVVGITQARPPCEPWFITDLHEAVLLSGPMASRIRHWVDGCDAERARLSRDSLPKRVQELALCVSDGAQVEHGHEHIPEAATAHEAS